MPKYDDFGRPIYETAEEYNRAHRAGNTTQSYSNRERKNNSQTVKKRSYGTQRTTGSDVKKSVSKRALVVAIGALAYILAMTVFLMLNSVRSPVGEYEEQWVEVEEIVPDNEGEYFGDDTTPLPEGFETFSYNGQSFSLPTTMEEINHMGFTLKEEYDESYMLHMLPTEYEETLILNDEDGFMAAMIRVSNYMDEKIPLAKAQVNYFYIENPTAYGYDEDGILPDFVFGDGLTFESSYDELEAYFGTPHYHYEDHSEEGSYYDNYEWAYYGEDETHFVSITFWNGVIADVGIEKRVLEE